MAVDWVRIFREAAQQYTFLETGPAAEPDPVEIPPRSAYISVMLRAARLTQMRRGLDRLHGVVHSVLRVVTDNGPEQFSAVVAPPEFGDVRAGRLDRFVQLNRRLLGPVPYVGGALDAQVGLLTVPSSELSAPYVSLLQTLGEQAVLPYASLARPFVTPLMQGVNLLVGGGRGTMVEIGLDTTWPQARAGRMLVLRMPHAEAAKRGVRLADDGLHVVDRDGTQVEDHPALILEILAERTRPDWPSIPELAAGYARVREAFRSGRRVEVDRALAEFRRIALSCVDLLPQDRLAVEACVRREVLDAGVPQTSARGGDGDVDEQGPVLRPLDELDIYGAAERS